MLSQLVHYTHGPNAVQELFWKIFRPWVWALARLAAASDGSVQNGVVFGRWGGGGVLPALVDLGKCGGVDVAAALGDRKLPRFAQKWRIEGTWRERPGARRGVGRARARWRGGWVTKMATFHWGVTKSLTFHRRIGACGRGLREKSVFWASFDRNAGFSRVGGWGGRCEKSTFWAPGVRGREAMGRGSGAGAGMVGGGPRLCCAGLAQERERARSMAPWARRLGGRGADTRVRAWGVTGGGVLVTGGGGRCLLRRLRVV